MARIRYRRKASFGPSIIKLVKLYRDNIRPVGDDTHAQAWINTENLLRDGLALKQLRQAVLNYKDFCERSNKEHQFRIHAANFFGQRAGFLQFLPENYEPPADARTDTSGRPLNWEG